MLVVVDTNILVSSLWSPNGAPAQVMSLIFNSILVPCYDHRILDEYQRVLSRPKFKFSPDEVNSIIDLIENTGNSVIPKPLSQEFTDNADKKFYEVAKFCHAKLITGNAKHFPSDPLVVTVNEFLDDIEADY